MEDLITELKQYIMAEIKLLKEEAGNLGKYDWQYKDQIYDDVNIYEDILLIISKLQGKYKGK